MKHLKWGMLVFVLATMLTTVGTTMWVEGVSRAAAPNCGSWSVEASPNNGTNSNYLYSATTVSNNDVWAAGYYVNTQNQVNRTLVEHWNGLKWKVVASFNYLTGPNALYGIAAASATDIWAVGYFTNNNVQRPMTELWNGSKWKFVKNPGIGPSTNILYSVAVASANNVWVVGTYVNKSGMNQTLIEQWNGTAWHVVSSPNVTGSTSDILTSVSVRSPNDIWAVGSYIDSTGVTQTLAEQWNGKAWHIVSSPNVAGSTGDTLTGVAIVTSSNVWAVGNYTNSSGVIQTLIEQWNGTSWNIISSPNVGSGNNVLTGAAIISSSNAWAVGNYTNSSNVTQTLTEQWNGTSWNVVPSANVGTGSNVFSGVAVTSAPAVWAVGNYANSSNVNQTLTEYYC